MRALLLFFIACLVVSGATAIPLQTELELLAQIVGADADAGQPSSLGWLLRMRDALVETNAKYPFIA